MDIKDIQNYENGYEKGWRDGYEKGKRVDLLKMFIGGIIVGGVATVWLYLLFPVFGTI